MSGPVFVVDLGRCTGCGACTLACGLENRLPAGSSFRRVTTFNRARLASLPVLHYSLACSHCEAPACLTACPARAYSRDRTTGSIVHDAGRCMGCAYCTWVCPFDAPHIVGGIARKCTLCAPRRSAGLDPACVSACPTGALRLAPETDRNDASGAPGLPLRHTRPRLVLLEPERGFRPPATAPPPADPPPLPSPPRPGMARVAREWPLLLFSSTTTLLVAVFAAAVLGGPVPRPAPFAVAAAVGLGLSLVHLGRPFRFWRALAGAATSWVSREALLAGLFAVLATVVLALGAAATAAGWAVAALGIGALVAVDMVYAVPGVEPAFPHPALATLAGPFLAAVLVGAWPAAAGAAAVKGALLAFGPPSLRPHRLLTALRIALGLVLPLLLWAASGGPPGVLVVVLVAVGEIVDRAAFYAALRFPSPDAAAAAALRALSAAPVGR